MLETDKTPAELWELERIKQSRLRRQQLEKQADAAADRAGREKNAALAETARLEINRQRIAKGKEEAAAADKALRKDFAQRGGYVPGFNPLNDVYDYQKEKNDYNQAAAVQAERGEAYLKNGTENQNTLDEKYLPPGAEFKTGQDVMVQTGAAQAEQRRKVSFVPGHMVA
jgi:hypothetical protein